MPQKKPWEENWSASSLTPENKKPWEEDWSSKASFKPNPTGIPLSPPEPQSMFRFLPGELAKRTAYMATEGGPATLGAAGGGILGSLIPGGTIPGAAIGSGVGEWAKNFIRKQLGGSVPSNQQGVMDVITAMAGGATLPVNAWQKTLAPGAISETVGALLPKQMTQAAARETVATAGERGTQMQARIRAMRDANRAEMQGEQATAENVFGRQKEQIITPLEEERRVVLNTKTAESARLAEAEKLRQGKVSQISELRNQATAAKQEITDALDKDSKAFAEGVGQRMDRTALSQGAEAARTQAEKEFSDKTTSLLTKNRAIYKTNPQEVWNGQVDKAGNQIMEKIEAPIDMDESRNILQSLGDRLKNDLRIAKQNGSPGASAVVDIMDGPRYMPADSVFDLKAALNQVGYGRGDVVTKPAEAIARKAASAVNQAFEKGVKGLQIGGDEAATNLEAIAKNQAKRDLTLRTGGVLTKGKVAQITARSIEQGGKLVTIANNPVKLKSWWPMADEASKNGMRQAVADDTIGDSYKAFTKKWSSMDPEVKTTIFTPEKIAAGDALASRGTAALRDLADQTIARHSQIIRGAQARMAELAAQRRAISDLTIKQRGITAEIGQRRGYLTDYKKVRGHELEDIGSILKGQTDETATQMKQNHEIDIRVARQVISDAQALKRKLLIAGGVAGLAGSWKAYHVAQLLGW